MRARPIRCAAPVGLLFASLQSVVSPCVHERTGGENRAISPVGTRISDEMSPSDMPLLLSVTGIRLTVYADFDLHA